MKKQMNECTLLILAAGMGNRYGGLKQIDKLGPGGETIIDYSVYDAMQAGFSKIVFVIRKDIEHEFKAIITDKYKGKIKLDYVFQEIDALPSGFHAPKERTKPWGTAHAVLMAKEKINGFFAVINGDDFYGKNAFVVLFNYLNALSLKDTHACCMASYRLADTLSENGSVSRGVCTVDENHNLTHVQEYTQLTCSDNKIVHQNEDGTTMEFCANTPVSMNFWGFHPAVFAHIEPLFVSFLQKNILNPKAEFYIPFAADDLIKSGKIQVKVLETNSQWYGVTYNEDRRYVKEKFSEMIKANIYPSVLW
ncbi:MAG: nucleotidyltransferase [Bacteroidales bacterium]|jgi:dTDP-glucose pyrophosphorylase|nr:nucleotidyltransferase [Bacteroidales bacterium]